LIADRSLQNQSDPTMQTPVEIDFQGMAAHADVQAAIADAVDEFLAAPASPPDSK